MMTRGVAARGRHPAAAHVCPRGNRARGCVRDPVLHLAMALGGPPDRAALPRPVARQPAPLGPRHGAASALIEGLARQGWYVRDSDDGLVIGEPARGTRVSSCVLRDARVAALGASVETAPNLMLFGCCHADQVSDLDVDQPAGVPSSARPA